jgi:hypothetical protein
MTREDAVAHATDWIEAWNSHDLERILAHYAQDVVFEAETVKTRRHKSDGRLDGLEELRMHFARGLELVPALRFQLGEVFMAPSGYAIFYRRDNGNRVIDAVSLNDEDRARRVTAYYAADQK